VEASVVQNQQAPLLLGQSVLERFGTMKLGECTKGSRLDVVNQLFIAL
jgi:hypothetical protein